MPRFFSHALPRRGAPALLALALFAGGCASSTSGGGTSSSSSAAVSAAGASSEVTVADPWVRATKGIPDPSMSTVFGQFTNHTDHDRMIVSATNSLTGRTELHQMSMNGDVMVMGPAATGIKLAANSTTSLDPNSLHIMIMNLASTILPGDQVTVTAKLDDGSAVTFQALAKDYAGGNESYPSGSAMPGMTMTSAMSGAPMGSTMPDPSASAGMPMSGMSGSMTTGSTHG